jgi:hypothetical protein
MHSADLFRRSRHMHTSTSSWFGSKSTSAAHVTTYDQFSSVVVDNGSVMSIDTQPRARLDLLYALDAHAAGKLSEEELFRRLRAAGVNKDGSGDELAPLPTFTPAACELPSLPSRQRAPLEDGPSSSQVHVVHGAGVGLGLRFDAAPRPAPPRWTPSDNAGVALNRNQLERQQVEPRRPSAEVRRHNELEDADCVCM